MFNLSCKYNVVTLYTQSEKQLAMQKVHICPTYYQQNCIYKWEVIRISNVHKKQIANVVSLTYQSVKRGSKCLLNRCKSLLNLIQLFSPTRTRGLSDIAGAGLTPGWPQTKETAEQEQLREHEQCGVPGFRFTDSFCDNCLTASNSYFLLFL